MRRGCIRRSLVALVGTSATLVAIVLDYWLIGWLVNHHLVKPVVQESRWFTFASRWFRKAPALLIAGSALAPVPFYPVKIMAIAADYPLRRFMAALIVGRLPRFYFLARFLSELDDYAAPSNSTLDDRSCSPWPPSARGGSGKFISRRLPAADPLASISARRRADSREQRPHFGPAILLIAAAAGSNIAAGESDDQAPEHAVAHMVRSAFDAGHLIEWKRLRPSFFHHDDFRRTEGHELANATASTGQTYADGWSTLRLDRRGLQGGTNAALRAESRITRVGRQPSHAAKCTQARRDPGLDAADELPTWT